MSAYHVLIIEPLDGGLEMVSSVGPFSSWTFARSAAHRFEQKRDAAGYTASDVKVRVSKQIAPEDFEWDGGLDHSCLGTSGSCAHALAVGLTTR